MMDRLMLDEPRIEGIVAGLRAVAAQDDPVGAVLAEWDMPSAFISKRSAPLVVGVIYESRPNVTADAGALCQIWQCGDPAGGSGFHSSGAVHAACKPGCVRPGCPKMRCSLYPPGTAPPLVKCWA